MPRSMKISSSHNRDAVTATQPHPADSSERRPRAPRPPRPHRTPQRGRHRTRRPTRHLPRLQAAHPRRPRRRPVRRRRPRRHPRNRRPRRTARRPHRNRHLLTRTRIQFGREKTMDSRSENARAHRGAAPDGGRGGAPVRNVDTAVAGAVLFAAAQDRRRVGGSAVLNVLPCQRCDEVPPCPCTHGSREAAVEAWRARLLAPVESSPSVGVAA